MKKLLCLYVFMFIYLCCLFIPIFFIWEWNFMEVFESVSNTFHQRLFWGFYLGLSMIGTLVISPLILKDITFEKKKKEEIVPEGFYRITFK